jgi:hypothetical protein
MPNDGGPLQNVGSLTLDRWVKEPVHHHRALLLLAMQDPNSNPNPSATADGRNVQRVISCMTGLAAAATVRKWVERRKWVDRIRGHGPDAQAYAIELYRAYYMDQWGSKDLKVIGHLVSLPMDTRVGVNPVSASAVQDEALRIVKRIMPPDPEPEVQKAVAGEIRKQKDRTLRINRNIQRVAEASIIALKESVQAAVDPKFRKANPHVEPIRPKLSDLPKLRDLLSMLMEEERRIETPDVIEAAGGTTPIIDSVRVRIAKESGTNILAAVREDCLEMAAMVEAMLVPNLTLAELQIEDEAERSEG